MSKINVPPPDESVSLTVGDKLTIHAAQACTFTCTIGANFSPSLASVSLSQGDNGPYTAETAGSGTYDTPSNPSPALTAKSIQISNPPLRKHPK